MFLNNKKLVEDNRICRKAKPTFKPVGKCNLQEVTVVTVNIVIAISITKCELDCREAKTGVHTVLTVIVTYRTYNEHISRDTLIDEKIIHLTKICGFTRTSEYSKLCQNSSCLNSARTQIERANKNAEQFYSIAHLGFPI
jgi:hypothetical protein